MNDLPRPVFRDICGRAIRLRCPRCGKGKLYSGLRMVHDCPSCGLSFYRESGYYVGAMIVNYGMTAAIVIVTYLVSLTLPVLWPASIDTKIWGWFAFAIVVSAALIRHSRSLWLAVDYWIEPWSPE